MTFPPAERGGLIEASNLMAFSIQFVYSPPQNAGASLKPPSLDIRP